MDYAVLFLLGICALVSSQENTTNEFSITTTIIDEEVPSKPLNVSVLDVGANSISLRWREPEHANGAIEGYRVYYMYANYTDVRSIHISGDKILKYNLTKLKPDTDYKVWVKAFTYKNEGEPSEAILNRTDIAGPSAPNILNLTCQTQDTIYVQWKRPTKFYHSINYYHIYVSGEYVEDYVIDLEGATEYLDASYSIKNVSTNTNYEVRLSASSRSINTGKLVQGMVSEPMKVHMQIDCDKQQLYMRRTTHELSAGMIAGVVCAGVAFVLAVMAFVLWRKFFSAPYYYLDSPQCAIPTTSLEWNALPVATSEQKGPIPVHMFSKHVAELHADGDIGFSKEYETVQAIATQNGHSSEHSMHPDNRAKNRYLNITAYDHSIVQLLPMPGQKKNVDYINANYIDGFSISKAYIGTQGPLPSTFDCFWRMVWEQRVSVIVMITNLVERGRRKCDMYWPKEGTETYGVIQVTLVKEEIMATYTIRTLQIRHLRIKKKKGAVDVKTVCQYHYTNWPDHGTPDHPLPVIHFIKKTSAVCAASGGPIVVHCSAGVGRTGTYIVIDAMLKQIRARNEVNIFGFLTHIRGQRNFLVQTEEQYIFMHDALVEAIEAGETYIDRDHLPKYVEAIQSGEEDKTNFWKDIESQFKLVTSFQCKEFNVVNATKPINQPKNRRMDILPLESSRVHLTPRPGEEGTDYINGTWLQGFHSLREFIITQHPMKSTKKEFWQMVWEHNVQTIVNLSAVDSQDYPVFWPGEGENLEYENFKMKLTSENVLTKYVQRDFTMQSLQDDYELNVRMFHWADWPHHLPNMKEMCELPEKVEVNQLGFQNGPLVVIDRFGFTEAALFCCLRTFKKHLNFDGHLDIFMYAKLYHNRRPGIWTSIDDFIKLHLAAQFYCCPPEGAPDLCPVANGAVNGSLSNDSVRVPPEGMEAVGPKLTVA